MNTTLVTKISKAILLLLFVSFISFIQASNLYKIKKIEPDNTVYIIIAERNDSLFQIATPIEEIFTDHTGLKKLKVGGKYNLQLESYREFIRKYYPWIFDDLHFAHDFWGTNVPYGDFHDVYTCRFLDGLWVMPEEVRPKEKEIKAEDVISMNLRLESYNVTDSTFQHVDIEISNNSDGILIWIMFEPDSTLSDDDMFTSRFLTPDSSGVDLRSRIFDKEVTPEELTDVFSNLFVNIYPHEIFTISINGPMSETELKRFMRSIRINKTQDFMHLWPLMGIINMFNPPVYPSDTLTIDASQIRLMNNKQSDEERNTPR